MEAGLQQTPSADRIHIAFFGRRNAGKSSLVNAITNQTMSIVSEIQGTTTDPVRKAMELLPLGAVVIIDTPGLDDEGTLGSLRMQKTKEILHRTDLAVIVINSTIGKTELETKLEADLQQQQIPFLEVYNQCDLHMPEQLPDGAIAVSAKTGFHISELKEKMAACYQKQVPKTSRSLLGNFVQQDDIILLVTPIDESAPKGRMIGCDRQSGISAGQPDCSAGNRLDFVFYLICTLSRCTAKGSDCRRYAGIFAKS